ncbi:MAG: hypothetical protein COV36_08145 [Alphaproteobacteria bacterium CG11_big_fil_rev_8_21_14_0_20_44_7]|nr:MAG: hypothetical protein COV36_08145 [Alphaproteobacteria bacterium CG11_big_fil_rev_8_21_14_0_20_44_7]
MDFGTHKKRSIEISTIPIINIVFLLLIFFIVQGTLRSTDVLPIDAPVSLSGSAVVTEPLEILIGEDEVILDLELVSDKLLEKRLINILKTDPEAEIMLKADANLNAVRLIEILQLVREAGVKNLYLITSAPI